MPAGRPRGVDDSVILKAAAEVMGRTGPSGLTLAAVAHAAGVVPGTLMQRFGSKRGLLIALSEHSARTTRERLDQVRQGHGSALAALLTLTVGAMEEMSTPETFANHLAFLCLDLTDPELHGPALAVHRAQVQALRDVLGEAVSAGELRAGTDVAALAASVRAMTAGAGLTWALEREGTLPQRLRREIRTLLAPHVPPEHLSHLEDPAGEKARNV